MAPTTSWRKYMAGLWSGLAGGFLVCFLACVVSGVVLALQYRPMGQVADNLQRITHLIPYGWFWRGIHYLSGQACAVLALLHVARYLSQSLPGRAGAIQWARLIGCLALCFGLLFTGFLLQGGQEALLAARVLTSTLESLPLAGGLFARALIGEGDTVFFLPYLHHCVF
ncbi:MAG: DUF4405 domain-containing protein, partial [Desulfovibrio sp.]